MTKLENEILLQVTKEAQFEILMKQYGRKILHFVYLLTKDRSMAEDITQEVFVKVYQHLHTFRGESQIQTWIYKIALNEAKNQRRKWSFRRLFYSPNMDELKDARDHYSPRFLETIQKSELASLIMRLPWAYRQVIALHYFQELSIQEVGHILGLSEGATRNKLYRARNRLKEILQKEGFAWD